MTKKEILKKLIKIQKLLWEDDDSMDQTTLFQLQEEMQDLVFRVAHDTEEHEIIVSEFPWLYRLVEKPAPPNLPVTVEERDFS